MIIFHIVIALTGPIDGVICQTRAGIVVKKISKNPDSFSTSMAVNKIEPVAIKSSFTKIPPTLIRPWRVTRRRIAISRWPGIGFRVYFRRRVYMGIRYRGWVREP
jgi:hypothetical protein